MSLKQILYNSIPIDIFVETIVDSVIQNPAIDYNQVKQTLLDNKESFDKVPVIHLEDHPNLSKILAMLLRLDVIENKKMKGLLKQAYLSSVTGRRIDFAPVSRYKPGTLESDDEADDDDEEFAPRARLRPGVRLSCVYDHDVREDYYDNRGYSQEKPY